MLYVLYIVYCIDRCTLLLKDLIRFASRRVSHDTTRLSKAGRERLNAENTVFEEDVETRTKNRRGERVFVKMRWIRGNWLLPRNINRFKLILIIHVQVNKTINCIEFK